MPPTARRTLIKPFVRPRQMACNQCAFQVPQNRLMHLGPDHNNFFMRTKLIGKAPLGWYEFGLKGS
jgi:hypothetical protein